MTVCELETPVNQHNGGSGNASNGSGNSSDSNGNGDNDDGSNDCRFGLC